MDRLVEAIKRLLGAAGPAPERLPVRVRKDAPKWWEKR